MYSTLVRPTAVARFHLNQSTPPIANNFSIEYRIVILFCYTYSFFFLFLFRFSAYTRSFFAFYSSSATRRRVDAYGATLSQRIAVPEFLFSHTTRRRRTLGDDFFRTRLCLVATQRRNFDAFRYTLGPASRRSRDYPRTRRRYEYVRANAARQDGDE